MEISWKWYKEGTETKLGGGGEGGSYLICAHMSEMLLVL